MSFSPAAPEQMDGLQADWGFRAYVYLFARVLPGGEARGATHVFELAYVFNQYDQHPEWTEADPRLAETMSTYWVNFAGNGRTDGQDLPD